MQSWKPITMNSQKINNRRRARNLKRILTKAKSTRLKLHSTQKLSCGLVFTILPNFEMFVTEREYRPYCTDLHIDQVLIG